MVAGGVRVSAATGLRLIQIIAAPAGAAERT
jgi:hypothetical protein